MSTHPGEPQAGGPEQPWQPTVLDCSQALLRMFEYLDGEMTGADAHQIQAHLDECAECLRLKCGLPAIELVMRRERGVHHGRRRRRDASEDR